MDAQEGKVNKGHLISNHDGSVEKEAIKKQRTSKKNRVGKGETDTSTTTPAIPTTDVTSSTSVSIERDNNIEFGGKSHRTFESDYVGDENSYDWTGQHLGRPEAWKSEACVDDACQGCKEPEKCWHGIEISPWGYMSLKVPGGGQFNLYTAEVWVRCSSTMGELKFKPYKAKNGEISLTVNGVERHTEVGTYTSVALDGDKRLRVSFAPKDQGKNADALFYLSAWKVSSAVDRCMTGKECLDKLGDGSDAAFEMRNNNPTQYECLHGDMSTMNEELRKKCEEWNQCLARTGKKDHLLTLLKAATAPSPGSLITRDVP